MRGGFPGGRDGLTAVADNALAIVTESPLLNVDGSLGNLAEVLIKLLLMIDEVAAIGRGSGVQKYQSQNAVQVSVAVVTASVA
jgi:hypothetical protein